ncbi:transcription factor bHLH95 [Typha angustifolia]|uniref:transcription factor bHLH95 n=1 Tax=Typha angustifolia TaxID=59011 RepID=UPI003C2B270C
MSQEGDGCAEGQVGLLWDVQPWVFCNSDNSGGIGIGPLASTRPLESSTNSPSGLKAASKSSSSKGGVNETKGGGESDHEIHIWTERERRKKMRNMFSSLHALLPQLPPKADKSTIVDEAVNYIKSLQQTLQRLQKQKLDRLRGIISDDPSSSIVTREMFMADQAMNWSAMSSPSTVSVPQLPHCFQTWSSPNVVLSVTGEDAHISICATKKSGIFTTILYVLEKHKLEVVSAHVTSDCLRVMCMIHAHASGVSEHFPETLAIEGIYKLAVGEIILWLSA